MDHVDGNRLNNDISNLQTLCANCHRLKTHEKRDYIKKNKHEPLRFKDAQPEPEPGLRLMRENE
jgi:5-methylcytosine-specific restriction endonuclease McrA